MPAMDQARSKTPLIYFTLVLIIAVVTALVLINKCSSDNSVSKKSKESAPNAEINLIDDIHQEPETTPEELIGKISEVALKANEAGDVQPLLNLLGKNNLTQEQARQLGEFVSRSQLKLDPSNPFSKVEGHPQRWSLNLADKSKIIIDFEKTETGKWRIKSITLPEKNQESINGVGNDHDLQGTTTPLGDQSALIAIRQFLQAIKRLDPAAASKHIDSSQISYAKLAGLCIIFEEGEYELLEDKALRKMFLKDTSSGWLVRLQSKDTGKNAMFSITSKRKDINSPWLITEINLDNLLADYTRQFLDGDIHYSPLIKNPKGGDTLAIYFDLDAKDLTSRTKRQLAIVADLLKISRDKKLTISGHTDALGSDPYNLALSQARAEQVMRFLSENGIDKEQMKITGYGKSQPRLPNTTASGEDFPQGRRANRRAEILLDF